MFEFNSSVYNKNIKQQKNFSFTFLIVLIIILLACIILLKPKTKNVAEFYFVEIECCSNFKQASQVATTSQNLGCAGYVYYEKNYHVLAGFYENYDNAKKVAENIKNDFCNAKVFTLSSYKPKNFKNLTTQQNETIKNVYNKNMQIINKFYEIDEKYTKNTLSNTEINTNLQIFKDDLFNNANAFAEQFKTNSKFNASKQYLIEIANNVANLNANNQNFNVQLKYCLINIVVYNHYFVSSF